jgi:hypothetical protein
MRPSGHHRLMDFAAITYEIFLCRNELLERRIDVAQIDVCDEAVEPASMLVGADPCTYPLVGTRSVSTLRSARPRA